MPPDDINSVQSAFSEQYNLQTDRIPVKSLKIVKNAQQQENEDLHQYRKRIGHGIMVRCDTSKGPRAVVREIRDTLRHLNEEDCPIKTGYFLFPRNWRDLQDANITDRALFYYMRCVDGEAAVLLPFLIKGRFDCHFYVRKPSKRDNSEWRSFDGNPVGNGLPNGNMPNGNMPNANVQNGNVRDRNEYANHVNVAKEVKPLGYEQVSQSILGHLEDKCNFHDPFAILKRCHDQRDAFNGNPIINGIFNNNDILDGQLQKGPNVGGSMVEQGNNSNVQQVQNQENMNRANSVHSAASHQRAVPHYQPQQSQHQHQQPQQHQQPPPPQLSKPPNLQRKQPPSAAVPPHIQQRKEQRPPQHHVKPSVVPPHLNNGHDQPNGSGSVHGSDAHSVHQSMRSQSEFRINGSNMQMDNGDRKEQENVDEPSNAMVIQKPEDICDAMAAVARFVRQEQKEKEQMRAELAQMRQEIRELKIRLQKYEPV